MGLAGNPIGRPSIGVEYRILKDYVVGNVLHNSKVKSFIIDIDDFENVRKYNWYVVCDYIGTRIDKKIMYLHNFVMNKLTFEGKGQKETVDHISRNPLDNRKCNLRMISQSDQNMNQNKKPRNVILPENCNLTSSDLPKHVYYVSARGNHNDGFCVEFKRDGKKIYNPYIRSRLSIEEKLEKIKVLLEKGYELYPEYNPNYEKELRDKLEEEYKTICQLPA